MVDLVENGHFYEGVDTIVESIKLMKITDFWVSYIPQDFL
jgi:hypothetical protein